jgi:Fe(3+) dicitrate transport protein
MAYTWTQGEFDTSFESDFADWAPAVFAGDAMPYLAEHHLFAELGWTTTSWAAYLSMDSTSAMRTTAGRGPVASVDEIEARTLFGFSLQRTLAERCQLYVQGRNLLDTTYVAARRPYGLRPGMDRAISAGIRLHL